GIIGAGPGGMAAAEELRRRGYQIHVYDRHDRVGGLLLYGIPNFKLEKSIVQALDYLTASNRKGLGDAVARFDDGTLNAEGKNVVVVGGGDTAMDCVR